MNSYGIVSLKATNYLFVEWDYSLLKDEKIIVNQVESVCLLVYISQNIVVTLKRVTFYSPGNYMPKMIKYNVMTITHEHCKGPLNSVDWHYNFKSLIVRSVP